MQGGIAFRCYIGYAHKDALDVHRVVHRCPLPLKLDSVRLSVLLSEFVEQHLRNPRKREFEVLLAAASDSRTSPKPSPRGLANPSWGSLTSRERLAAQLRHGNVS